MVMPVDEPFALFTAAGRDVLLLLALVPFAIAVFWWATRQIRREHGGSKLRPKGRTWEPRGRAPHPRWRTTVEQLEAIPATTIADACEGPIRIHAVIHDASSTLGGTCVWRNRVHASNQSAVGADLIILADATGHCGLETIEGARVIAPTEKITVHHDVVSVYLGDEVEILGHFTPESTEPCDIDPKQAVYGTISAREGLDVRILRRPAKAERSAPPHTAPENPL